MVIDFLNNILENIFTLECIFIQSYQHSVSFKKLTPLVKISKCLTRKHMYFFYLLIIFANNYYSFLQASLTFYLFREINTMIKTRMKQLRPYNYFPDQIRYYQKQKASYSFPSQSVQSITTVYYFINLCYPYFMVDLYFGSILTMLYFTRIYRGLHYPHDIIITYVLTNQILKYLI